MCEHNLYFLYCDCSIASFTPPPRFLLRVYPHFYPRTAPAKRARLDLGGGKGLDFPIWTNKPAVRVALLRVIFRRRYRAGRTGRPAVDWKRRWMPFRDSGQLDKEPWAHTAAVMSSASVLPWL